MRVKENNKRKDIAQSFHDGPGYKYSGEIHISKWMKKQMITASEQKSIRTKKVSEQINIKTDKYQKE